MAVNDPIQETTLSEKRATQNPTPLHTENKTAKEVEALEAALIVAELEKETVKTALQALHTEYEELLLVLKYLNTEYSSLLASFKSLNEEHTLLKQAHFSQQEAMLKKEINVLQDRLSVMMPSFQLGRSATAEAAVQSVTAVVNTITPQQWNQGVYIFFEKDVSRLFFQTFGATLQSEEKRLKVLIHYSKKRLLVQLIDRTLEDKSKDPLLLKVSQNGQFVLSETSLSAKEEARTREKDHAANANANAAVAPAPAPASEKEIDEVQRLAHQRRTQPLEKKKKLKILTTRDLEKIRERNPSPALISTFLCKTAHKTQVFPGAHAAEQIRRAREERFCKKRPR